MAHSRKLIREAAVSLLSGATAASTRVFETRMLPFRAGVELPAIAVYSEDETSEITSIAPRELLRTLPVEVVGVVRGADDDTVVDAMDALAVEIEKALGADETWGSDLWDSSLIATQTVIDPDGEQPTGFLKLTYQVQYKTYSPLEADLPVLDTFDTAGITYDLAGEQAAADERSDLLQDINQE